MLASLAPQRARASPVRRGAALSWLRGPGTEECPGAAEMTDRIERRVGRPLFVPAPSAALRIEGLLSRSDDRGYRAEIRVSDPSGELYGSRELRAPPDAPCERLAALAELVIAITLRPGGQSSMGIELPPGVATQLSAPPPPSQPAAGAPAPSPAALPVVSSPERSGASPQASGSVAPSATAPSPTSERPRHWELAAAIMASAVSGLQPAGSYGPATRLDLSLPHRMGLSLSAAWGVAREAGVAGSTGRVRYGSIRGGLSLCRTPWATTWIDAGVCAHGALGRLTATAQGFDQRNSTTSLRFGELGLEGRARLPLGRGVSLVSALRLLRRVRPPEVDYVTQEGQLETAFSVKSWALSGKLGLEVALWSQKK